MKTNKNQSKSNASDSADDYKPLPAIKLIINKVKYVYQFDKLTFMQVMLAEERAVLKNDRMDYISANPGIATQETADALYVADLASILFAPSEDGQIKFNEDNRDKVKEEFLNSDGSNFNIVEQVIMDFFIRRGNRSIASKTLRKYRGVMSTLKLLQLATSINAKIKSPDSAIPMSSNDAQTSASETA
jgi:hypothetical protein